MKLWTPAFQRTEASGSKSPNPVTELLIESNRDRVNANGPTSNAALSCASIDVLLRP